jgi:hypothetical protein
MLKIYFTIIRNALSENRQKGSNIYYEAHHIVPECLEQFGKKSSTVLLTAKEHYRVHKILADVFKDHPLYGNKMLWAFHRMTYSGDLELTEEEYSTAREALMKLWKRSKTRSFKDNISIKMKGNKNGLGNKKHWIPSEETRKKYSEIAIERQLGKVGEESRASKGIVICENIVTGEKIEAGSALQLANKLGMNCGIFHEELNRSNYSNAPKARSKRSKYYEFLQTHKIYYK